MDLSRPDLWHALGACRRHPWGSPTTISGDSDVNLQGTLDRAFNFGASTAPELPATVNGVPFVFFGVTTLASTTLGTTTLSTSAGNGTMGGTSEVGAAAAPFSNLSAPYQSLLRTAAFSNAGSTLTLTLSGLTLGQEYLFQWWVNDSRLAAGADRQATSTAGNSTQLEYNVSNTEGGVGQYVTGTFTADGTSQSITITGQTTGIVGPAPQVNAMQLRTVPEPAGALLLLAGGAMLLARRRGRA